MIWYSNNQHGNRDKK
ncbi:unnamed protein product, partial [Allacma fusca]